MKDRNETPDNLRPYIFHGVDLQWRENDTDAVAECPFCGKENKFNVRIKEGVYHCFSCQSKGNVYTFLARLLKLSIQETQTQDYVAFAKQRSLHVDTPIHWQVAKSYTTGQWLIPGYNAKGVLTQLYCYSKTDKGMRLLPTPTKNLGGENEKTHRGHGLHYCDFNKRKPQMFICEGPWDAMALWEVLGRTEWTGEAFQETASPERSLLSESNVIAVPGCSVFSKNWIDLFAKKDVSILFDNDHPRQHPKTGKKIEPAGWQGTQRLASLLQHKAESVTHLSWSVVPPQIEGEEAIEGHNPHLPSGFDLRDALTSKPSPLGPPLRAIGTILGALRPLSPEALTEGAKATSTGIGGKDTLEPIECLTYRGMQTAWKIALKWTEGLDTALAAMLASVISTNTVGDQLWLKIISPPSGGKSTLCEALSVNKEYIVAKSTIRGLHSGYIKDDKRENKSLIQKLFGKTLIIKDADTLIQSPNLPQILSEFRDAYDGTTRSDFRNDMGKDYEGFRMTVILSGTSSIRVIDQSELGARFLDCVIMDQIDETLEDAILLRVAQRASKNLGVEVSDSAQSQYDPDLALAMQLTGGYVGYLRENASTLLSGIERPSEALEGCMNLARFVASMRARPSILQEENAEKELASRLTSQLLRLAGCLAAVLNRKKIDSLVMEKVTKIALDTSRGQTHDIALHLYRNPDGCETKGVSLQANLNGQKTQQLLRFLTDSRIGVVEQFIPESESGVKMQKRWRLTPRMQKLYEKVMEL